ncbi:MAG: HesA/MoeB/ThiF family protein [Parafilimonas sp.]
MDVSARFERYQRQILLKEFGEAGQQKLLQVKVLVTGAGGLGCPVLQYLAAAGVGEIGIADDDVVSLTNLHRQVLYNMNDIGSSKAEVAAGRLKQLNPEIKIISYNVRLTNQNTLNIIEGYDMIVDGTDNFSSRYMINDACVLLNKPLVYGAISQFEGQVAIFNYWNNSNERPVNYRDLFPNPPKENEVLNCAEAGVLGVLPGIIGSMQANETIKLIAGIGEPWVNRLLTYNALTNRIYELKLSANEHTQRLIPKNKAEFLNTDYNWLCSSGVNDVLEINAEDFNNLLEHNNTTVIDVRETGEQPSVNEFEHLQIPLSVLKEKQSLVNGDKIVVFCQTGKRSLQAVRLLKEVFNDSKKIYSLKGGILEWKRARNGLVSAWVHK